MSISSARAKGNYIVAVKKSIVGAKVFNVAREELGTIEDVIIDSRNSRAEYAILSFGGFLGMGDKHFAIPWEAIDFHASDRIAILNIDKDRLKNAPGFDEADWPDMSDTAWRNRIKDHYGYRSSGTEL